MKKLSFILALVLMLSCLSCAFADDFDLTIVRENPGIYTLDVDTEDDVAFVETTLDAARRSFTHKYESTYRYSNTQFDILVIDYLTSSPRPVHRLWITYCADDNYMNITGVSFEVGGKKYTFSDIADPDWYEKDENGYLERVLIKFDMDNLDFLIALEDAIPRDLHQLADAEPITMTLHGRENITVSLGEGFMLDFLLSKVALFETNATDYLSQTTGSPMKVTDIAAP